MFDAVVWCLQTGRIAIFFLVHTCYHLYYGNPNVLHNAGLEVMTLRNKCEESGMSAHSAIS